MTDETLRQKHPQMRRPHMKNGTLTDMGEDLGPGRCPKAQEIDARLAQRAEKEKEGKNG